MRRRSYLVTTAAFLFLCGCHRSRPSVATVPQAPAPARNSKRAVTQTERHTPQAAHQTVAPPEQEQRSTRARTIAPGPSAPAPMRGEQLGDVLSDDQRTATNQNIEGHIQSALAMLRTNAAIATQKDVERIQALVRQARQEQAANNLVTAEKLAGMADVLAHSLVK